MKSKKEKVSNKALGNGPKSKTTVTVTPRIKKSPATRFIPHHFQSQTFLLDGMPRIIISASAFEDMYVLVDEVNKEVAWLGSVEQVGGDFLIEEIFLLGQETSGATAEITTEGIAKLTQQLLEEREDGMEVLNKLKFWGHSHVNMSTSASSQDEEQMSLFEENECSFFIRAIVNKLGRMEFTLFFFDEGLRINDVPWGVDFPVDDSKRKALKLEIEEKVGDIGLPPGRYKNHPHFRGRNRFGVNYPGHSGSIGFEGDGLDDHHFQRMTDGEEFSVEFEYGEWAEEGFDEDDFDEEEGEE